MSLHQEGERMSVVAPEAVAVAVAATNFNPEDTEVQNTLEAYSLLWNHSLGYLKSMCLKCVVELHIPDAIHRHGMPATISYLLSSLSIPEAKSRNLLTMMRLLSREQIFKSHTTVSGDEAFGLTPVSHLLISSATNRLSSSPIVLMLLNQHHIDPCQQLSRWFHESDMAKTPFEMAYGKSFWDFIRVTPDYDDLFSKGMASDSHFIQDFVMRAGWESFRAVESMVDVGGRTGTMAAALAEAFPGMKCTVFDLPYVVNTTQKIDGIHYVGGDMFSQVPPAQVLLLKWILHDWGDEDCVKILQRCKEAIPPKEKCGKVIIIEAVVDLGINIESTSLEMQLLFDLEMMIMVTGKQRDEGEWRNLFATAGFSGYKITSSIGSRSIIEVYP